MYKRRKRRGSSILEFALVAPIVISLMLSVLVAGLGVFRYEQVTQVARDASRWLAVHGSQYASETGNPAATATSTYQYILTLPDASGLNLTQSDCSVNWPAGTNPGDTVTVVISYQWMPQAFYGGLTLSSTSASTIFY